MNRAATQQIETTPRRRGPRKQAHLLTGSEEMILRRMMRIDRGEGCHATVERIGLSVDDRHVSFSLSQTRRHLRRLREMGHIHFAGQTAGGRNVYLFSEREYRPEQIPVCTSRPLDHLETLPSAASWSTAKAEAILNLADREGPSARVTVVDGFPVNKQLVKSYSQTTIKRAIAALKKAYPDPTRMKNRTALLRYFITLEMQEDKKRRDRALAEQTRNVVQGTAAPAELGSQLLALMREGRHDEAKALAASLEQASAALPCPTAAIPLQPMASSTVGEVVARFVERKNPGPDPTPTSFYSKKAEQLQRLLGPIRLAELTPAELTLYQRKRRSERVQEATVKAELKVLRQALGEATAAGLLDLSVLETLLPTSSRAGPPKAGPPGGSS